MSLTRNHAQPAPRKIFPHPGTECGEVGRPCPAPWDEPPHRFPKPAPLRTFVLLPLGFLLLICLTFSSSARSAEPGNLDLSLDEAILMTLENNPSFRIQRLNPEISSTAVERQKAAFDTALTGGVSASNKESAASVKSRSTSESIGLSKRLAGGESVDVSLSASNSNSASNKYSTGLGVSITKPLLQDAGRDVTLAALRQSELDAQSSTFELQAFAETLVIQVLDAYWDYALSERNIQIYESSLKLARDQLAETQTMVDVGKLAEVELVGARAEVALREQSLIDARARTESLRLTLLRLLHPGKPGGFWDTAVAVTDTLDAKPADLGDRDAHVATALKMRPELNQARLSLARGDLDLVKTRNGLLPYLDVFVSLGRTGYAQTFGSSAGDIFSDASDVQFGLNYKYTLGNRSDKATYKQSALKQEQLALAMDNLESLAQQDVRGAWIEVQRAQSQIAASRATLALQDEKLRAETEKYRVGRSTSLLVAQAQRDYLSAQVSEAGAISDYIKAVAALYQSEGDLLGRYGISM